MASVTLSFEVHQPFRLANFQPNGVTKTEELFNAYFNNGLNKWIFDRIADRCYLPTTKILLELIDRFKAQGKKFKVSFGFSGMFIESAEHFRPEVLDAFKALIDTGQVEVLGETYYHSLASLYESREEFIEQVRQQTQAVKDIFGFKPRIFVNTEMLYNNVIAKVVEDLGFKAIFTEGAERILGWRSPNYVYVRKYCFPNDPKPEKRIKVLLRNYRLSDDVSYRFSARWWEEWPLTADKYAAWLAATPGQVINLFMDFETFGEHQPADTGIFWFLRALPEYVLRYDNLEFLTPSEVIEKYEPIGEIDVFEFSTVSWADMERDTSAWLGNAMQQMVFKTVKDMEKTVKRLGNAELLRIWRLLQQSDHYYYVCNKWWSDGDVHKYFSSFATPEEAFANFMGIVSDFKARLEIEHMKSLLQKGEK